MAKRWQLGGHKRTLGGLLAIVTSNLKNAMKYLIIVPTVHRFIIRIILLQQKKANL
jgi:hypothetical protein